MKRQISLLILIVLLSACGNSQDSKSNRLVGGPCEGCEAIFDYGNKKLSPIDTLQGFNEKGQKIKVTGTIYQNDGKSPAKGIILYLYHTDQNGIYDNKYEESNWSKQHGYIRGWVKTDADGKYTFYTLKPGVYPSRTTPAHIHPTILEPNGKYYWIGAYHFEGDPLLTESEISPESPRGGSNGLLILKKRRRYLGGNQRFYFRKEHS